MSVFEIPRQLRTLLVKLYPTEEKSRRVVHDAQLKSEHIKFSNTAIDNWYAILQEAHLRRKVIAILDVAADEYKECRLDIAQVKLLYIINQANSSLPDIRTLYQKSRPTILEGSKAINTLEDVLNALWDMVNPYDRQLPILEFVERLAQHVQDFQLAEQLRQCSDWLAASGLLYNVIPTDLQELRTRLAANQYDNEHSSQESYLLVEVWPDTTKTRKDRGHRYYLVNIYLWKNEDDIVCWHNESRSYKVAEIPQLVYDTLNDHEEETPTIIEFFLPFELLTTKVNQWEVEVGHGIKSVLSYHYRIVVRSRERLRERDFGEARKAWRRRWDLFRTYQNRDISWHNRPNAYTPQEFYNRLLLSGEKVTCLGITFSPTAIRGNSRQPELLYSIIKAGIPVVLWPYQQHMHDMIDPLCQTLKTSLQTANLSQLPKIILDLPYIVNQNDQGYLHQHLVLFWDDPNRQPPAPIRVSNL